MASHEDLGDEGQTVSFTQPSPEIGTTATDGDDGDHEAYADADVTIVDEVRYENLETGVEHVMVGTLIDRDTAAPVEKDGSPSPSRSPSRPKTPTARWRSSSGSTARSSQGGPSSPSRSCGSTAR